MSFIEAILLGIIQGLTEFLPISSSGHLVLFQNWMDINIEGNSFEVVVHIGTLGSILFVFWPDISHLLKSISQKKTQKQILILALATLPAVVVGLLFKDEIRMLFDSSHAVSYALIMTGIVLLLSKFAKQKGTKLNWGTGLIVGIAQAIAIIPGISRSGFTISTALLLGTDTREAARFSFLLAIPAISGAGLLTALDHVNDQTMSITVISGGLLSSFLIGVLALKWLIHWLESGKYYWFGVYCIGIGVLSWVI